MTHNRAQLIVVEGCDRSGKTTQCQLLIDALKQQGLSVQLQKFPDRTTATGQIIDQYLKNSTELDDHAIHLLFSANRWESMKKLKETLEAGTTVVVDRYAFSGVAFSAAKGLDFEWCKNCDVGLLKPDLVLFLDLDPQVAQQRGDYGQERYENLEFQSRARQNFKKLTMSDWKVIDANKSISMLHEEIVLVVKSHGINVKQCEIEFNLWK